MRRIGRMIKDDLTYRIIGCAMKVHSTIGCGFQEVIYQRCLAIEMSRAGLSFGREVDIDYFTMVIPWDREGPILLWIIELWLS